MSKKSRATVKQWLDRSRGNRTLVIAGVVALVGVAAIGLLSISTVAGTLALATTHQPESFTELYFNDSANLPKIVVAGRPATFSYHITNDEAAGVTYHTRVTLVENGTLRVIQQSAVYVPNNGSLNVPVSFTATRPRANLELDVDLIGQGESIHFRSQS